METRKIQTQLSWRPEMDFDMGLNATIEWYMDNQDWVKRVSEDNCYSGRLGLLE